MAKSKAKKTKVKSNPPKRHKSTSKKPPIKIELSTSDVKEKSETAQEYKEGLMQVNKVGENFDSVFSEKLEQQYKEFQEIKQHTSQLKSLLRILAGIIIIVLITLLILTYTG